MDEKKTYTIIGKVEIGTDEYRDLIESLAHASAEADSQRSRRWDLEGKLTLANDKIKELTAEINDLLKFIRSDEVVATKLAAYRFQKQTLKTEADI
jgi:hypothetical protein